LRLASHKAQVLGSGVLIMTTHGQSTVAFFGSHTARSLVFQDTCPHAFCYSLHDQRLPLSPGRDRHLGHQLRGHEVRPARLHTFAAGRRPLHGGCFDTAAAHSPACHPLAVGGVVWLVSGPGAVRLAFSGAQGGHDRISGLGADANPSVFHSALRHGPVARKAGTPPKVQPGFGRPGADLFWFGHPGGLIGGRDLGGSGFEPGCRRHVGRVQHRRTPSAAGL